ncbi:MAG: dienelactone hydrolase family protein [Myxococcota bacterium]
MLLSLVCVALAAPRADAVDYTFAGATYSGFVVWDDAIADKRPGVVMVPNWMGVTESAVEKAKKIAGTRYVVFVADMYGKGQRPSDTKQAGEFAGKVYADRAAMRGRADAALKALLASKAPVDPAKTAAIGFCFGGSTALELARSGADVDAVVSFHGGLTTPAPAEKGKVRASVLVLNGAADGYVKPEDVAALQKEMTDAGADWTFVNFSGAVHCFAEADAKSPPGCVYDEKAATRAYAMMEDFLAQAWR